MFYYYIFFIFLYILLLYCKVLLMYMKNWFTQSSVISLHIISLLLVHYYCLGGTRRVLIAVGEIFKCCGSVNCYCCGNACRRGMINVAGGYCCCCEVFVNNCCCCCTLSAGSSTASSLAPAASWWMAVA